MLTPSLIRLPRPPYATSEPTVVSATVETVATRRPAMITGSASGSSTRNSSRPAPYPSPVADSRTSSGTARSPSSMARTRMVSA